MTSETSCPHLLRASTTFVERHPEERAAKPRASKGGALARSCPPSTDLGFTRDRIFGEQVCYSRLAWLTRFRSFAPQDDGIQLRKARHPGRGDMHRHKNKSDSPFRSRADRRAACARGRKKPRPA